MAKLVVAETFAPRLTQLQHTLPQSILIHGPLGSGLGTIARSLGDTSSLVIEPLTTKGDIDHEQGTISVERIRQLYEQTRSVRRKRLVVIIDDAERMSSGAQNAFLKLLEEPTAATHFILTSHHPSRLLPTVRSRVQQYFVAPISETQSRGITLSYRTLSDTQRTQALFVANGRAALLHRLCANPEQLATFAAVMSDARTYLTAPSRYQRLCTALRYVSSRQMALEFVDASLTITGYMLTTHPSSDLAIQSERLLQLRKQLTQNANPRLQLINSVVQ